MRSDTNNVSCLGFPVSTEKVLSLGIENTTVKNGHYQTRKLSVLSFESCGNRTEIQQNIAKNWSNLKREFEFIARYTAKDRLVEAITIFSEARKSRFLRRRTPRYCALNKGFTEEELQRFFKVIDDQRMHLLFSYQAILGLRIGEAVRIHIII